mgnify:CR=1 FL=1|jgi:uncharacterized protein YqjF (DUF2071 family)
MNTPTDEQRLAERQRPNSSVVMKQDWAHLLFLHWEIDPDVIQKSLPPGLSVDTYDGEAYLGIVPFFMQKVRPSYCPTMPWISWFQELNLRTYVHDDRGRPGVWFYALDCNQWLAVKLARTLFNLPYQHARMESSMLKGNLNYTSIRRGCGQPQFFKYPNQLSQPNSSNIGTLEFFLLERYRLFSADKNDVIYSGCVHHTPYQFQEVDVTDYSTRLFSLCGFEEPDSPPVSSLMAETVSVDIHPLKKN